MYKVMDAHMDGRQKLVPSKAWKQLYCSLMSIFFGFFLWSRAGPGIGHTHNFSLTLSFAYQLYVCVYRELEKKTTTTTTCALNLTEKTFSHSRGRELKTFLFFLAWQLMKAYSVMTSVETKGVIDYNRRLISTRTEKKSSFLFCPARGGDPVI